VSAWHLECSACDHVGGGRAIASVCPRCGQPLLVRYDSPWPAREVISDRWDLWRYRTVLPIDDAETPVSLGEGVTPLLDAPSLARAIGVTRLWIKDEGRNPTASFKARGMSAAVTRAKALGVPGLVVPTAGNAGAALAAYGAAASLPVRVFAPASTPSPILSTIRALGAELDLVDGHIGDAGKRSRAFAEEQGWFDMSTLREPYRIEGKKTMGIEIAEQMRWRLPTHVVYPTGGGTGLIGMWKVFAEMRGGGWLRADVALPRMISAQAAGCAPIVRAFESGALSATPWEDPQTHASGLRVPGPLGDRLILRAIRESGGTAAWVSEDVIARETLRLSRETGVDAAPEGGCALGVLEKLVRSGEVGRESEVVLFNTGSGASYRF
jgi:threonine synthase